MDHVLVIDDEAGFRDVLKRILVSSGYDVQVAVDAHDAMRSIGESQPGLIFCDIHMPGRDGLWLVDQVRRLPTPIPVVLCTSDDTIPPMETLRDGIIAYVLKPFRRHAILAAAAEAAEWYRTRTGRTVTRTKPLLEEEMPSAPAADEARPSRRSGRGRSREPRLSRTSMLVIAILVAAAVFAAAYWYLTRDARTLDHVAAAAGVVEVFYASGQPLAQGSGFFVAPQLFVTNQHVLQGGTRATIRRHDGSTMHVTGVAGVDRQGDLAVLKTEETSDAVLALSTDRVTLGDRVMVYGSPLGLAGTLQKGFVNAAPLPDAERIQISAPLSPGSSGSPVVDSGGRVIGIASESRTLGEGLGFAVPVRRLSQLLTEAAPIEPLIAASRGAGTALDRFQLIGDVRRLDSRCADATPDSAGCAVTRVFDRSGRLIQEQRTAGTSVRRTDYSYADNGRLARVQTTTDGGPVQTWEFVGVDAHTIEATASDGAHTSRRRLTYDDRQRLVSDETVQDGALLTSTHWHYDPRMWPVAGTGDAVAPPSAENRYDALGNLVREVRADGVVVTHRYSFDQRGNWILREDVLGDDPEHAQVIGREQRRIDYW
jgi:YD repeat-containing protein